MPKSPKGKGSKALIEPTRAFKRTLAMMEQDFLPRRSAAIQRYIAYQSAQHMLEVLKGKIPQTPDYAGYRSALKVVQSGAKKDPIFAVVAEPDKTPIEANSDLLYIRPVKRRGQAPDPLVAALVEFQPWTVDSLPFDVDSKFGQLVTRRVSRREVVQVAEAREKDKPALLQRLKDLGVVAPPKKAAIPKGVTAVPDLTYTALRLEYGLGRTKAVAHWRPAVREAPEFATRIFEQPKIGSALLNWKDMRWRRWSDLEAEGLPTKRVAALGKFQDKVSK